MQATKFLAYIQSGMEPQHNDHMEAILNSMNLDHFFSHLSSALCIQFLFDKHAMESLLKDTLSVGPVLLKS